MRRRRTWLHRWRGFVRGDGHFYECLECGETTFLMFVTRPELAAEVMGGDCRRSTLVLPCSAPDGRGTEVSNGS